MVKDTEKAGTGGQPTSQRGDCFKFYRREEQEESNLDSVEMLLQSGGEHLLVFISSETWRREDKQKQGKRKKKNP